MNVYQSMTELIGHTPLLELVNFEKKYNLQAKIFAKLESFNPAGSAKDRVAKEIIEDYEKRGLLNKDTTIIEPTSGNTGIGLAAICATRGYKLIIVMPDSMSVERIKTMKAYGAEVLLTPGALGMKGSIDKAEELKKTIPNAIIAGQFVNPANPMAHYKTTGPEIYSDLDGKVDIFVATIGTGGTISGTGKYLKEKNPKIKVIGIEPLTSAVITTGKAGPHKIQGIGAGYIPDTLNLKVIDEVITVDNDTPFALGKEMAKLEGLLVGISSGACLYAAIQVATRPENKGKNIVVLLPDTGDRYLSTPLFGE